MTVESCGESASALRWIEEARHRAERTLAGRIAGRPVVLLDIPTHMNVGDSLIWEGERQYLSRVGADLEFECAYERITADRLGEISRDAVVLLHGGGNFGDLWPAFHETRLRVVRQLSHHTVIQMPQSIFFRNDRGLRETARVVQGHPDFTLFVRDYHSLGIAKRAFPNLAVEFLEDMALGFRAPSRYAREGPVLVLARTDIERQFDLGGLLLPDGSRRVDWVDSRTYAASWRLSRIPRRVQRMFEFGGQQISKIFDPWVNRSYSRMRRMSVNHGVELFAGSSLIITDRLHAHILAGLMGIPCIALDNSYGKIRAVFEAYTHQFENSWLAGSTGEAQDLYMNLLDTRYAA